MYLALIPDEQTFQALRAFAPALPSDTHCTIIHSKAPLPAGLPLPEWPNLNLRSVETEILGPAIFGSKVKVAVLKLRIVHDLVYLRGCAEQIVQHNNILWSKEWVFSPHITIGCIMPLGAVPSVLRFDRMEWRP